MKLNHIKKEISGGEMQMGDPAHILDEMVYIPNKSSRNDVIEYNPVELSLEDSDASGNYPNMLDLLYFVTGSGHSTIPKVVHNLFL